MTDNDNTPDNDKLKKHFEANMLDGDEVQDGQMLSSKAVLEYLQDTLAQAVAEAIDRIDESITQHTTPEGIDLITRSYVKRTLEFERGRTAELTKQKEQSDE